MGETAGRGLRGALGRLLRPAGLAALAGLLTAGLALPLGPLPALGPTFNPVTGIFRGAPRPLPADLRLSGLHHEVRVVYDEAGVPHIFAADDHDLFLAEGYVVARDRLVQIDLMRRQAEGRLAEILGPGQVESDLVQVTLGLRRTAEAAAQALAERDPEAYELLSAYVAGVNAWIAELRERGAWPVPFRLLGYEPAPYRPADALAIQALMAEILSFDAAPLARAELVRGLGSARTLALFPPAAVNPQLPYDPGPYAPPDPPDVEALRRAALPFGAGAGVGGVTAEGPLGAGLGASAAREARPDPVLRSTNGSAAARGVLAALAALAGSSPLLAELGEGLTRLGNSNNWAVDGTITDTGKPYLAGDPHLALTLPSIWYEVQLSAPDLEAAGVIIPGLPGVLIGHNAHVAWSLTNVGSQQAFYYVETTSPDQPGKYLHDGTWIPFDDYRARIDVKGRPSLTVEVPWTVHGPVVSGLASLPDGMRPPSGETISLAWTGNLFSDDVGAVLRLLRARGADDVRQALRLFGSPAQNFAYATTDGDIGIIAAGLYPTLPEGAAPWLPMAGTGEWDWTGLVPYDRVPQVLNPPQHFVWSANQRPVGPDYPYYLGQADHFDPGYRARTIHDYLADPAHRPFTLRDMEALQAQNRDALAQAMVPAVVRAVLRDPLASDAARRGAALLASWDFTMRADEAAPAVWWTFLTHYVDAVFGPWWKAAGLEGAPGLAPEPGGAFVELLERLTVAEPGSPEYEAVARPDGLSQSWFYDPASGVERSRDDVIVAALDAAMGELADRLGGDTSRWRWGDLHHRSIPSLFGAPALGRGPYPADGDRFTPNAAGGEPSTSGPSWRMVADLSNLGRTAGVYPGGQSGDPLGPHYDDFLDDWLAYRYRTSPWADAPPAGGGWAAVEIRLVPAGEGERPGGGSP
ncbi:MAG: penicillin acylase family protein [Clostridia bacterium]|nr:penicillin acylase family protein [Clostridia bacterium]